MVWKTGTGVSSENVEDYVAHVRNGVNADKLGHMLPKQGARNLDQGFLDNRDRGNVMTASKEYRASKVSKEQTEFTMEQSMRMLESKIVEHLTEPQRLRVEAGGGASRDASMMFIELTKMYETYSMEDRIIAEANLANHKYPMDKRGNSGVMRQWLDELLVLRAARKRAGGDTTDFKFYQTILGLVPVIFAKERGDLLKLLEAWENPGGLAGPMQGRVLQWSTLELQLLNSEKTDNELRIVNGDTNGAVNSDQEDEDKDKEAPEANMAGHWKGDWDWNANAAYYGNWNGGKGGARGGKGGGYYGRGGKGGGYQSRSGKGGGGYGGWQGYQEGGKGGRWRTRGGKGGDQGGKGGGGAVKQEDTPDAAPCRHWEEKGECPYHPKCRFSHQR